MSFTISSDSSRNYRIKVLEPYEDWYDFEFSVDIPPGDSSDNLLGDHGFNNKLEYRGECIWPLQPAVGFGFSVFTNCETDIDYQGPFICADINHAFDNFHFIEDNRTGKYTANYEFDRLYGDDRLYNWSSGPNHHNLNGQPFRFYKNGASSLTIDVSIARMLALASSLGCDTCGVNCDCYDYVSYNGGFRLQSVPQKGNCYVEFFKGSSGWCLVTDDDTHWSYVDDNDIFCVDFRHCLPSYLCDKLNFKHYIDNHYCSWEDRCNDSCSGEELVYDGNIHSTADVVEVYVQMYDSGGGYFSFNSNGCPCSGSEDDEMDCECICGQLNSLNYNIVNGLSEIDDSIFLLANKIESFKSKLSGDINDYSDKVEESLNDINNVLLSLSNLLKSSCDTSITDVLSEAFNSSNCAGSVFKTTLGGTSFADSFSQSFNMLDGYGSVFKDNSLTLDDTRSFFNLIKDMFKNPCDNSGLTGLSYLFTEAFNRENCQGSVFKDDYDIYHTITDYFENAFFKINQPFLRLGSSGSNLPAYRFSGFNLGLYKHNESEYSFTDVLRRAFFSLNSDNLGSYCRIQDSHFFNGGELTEKLLWLDCSNNPVNLKWCDGHKPDISCSPDVNVTNNVPVPSVTVENNVSAATPTIKNYVHTDNYVDTIVESNNWSYQARSKYDFFNENDS